MASVGSHVVVTMEADASQVDLGMKRAAKATKNYEKKQLSKLISNSGSCVVDLGR